MEFLANSWEISEVKLVLKVLGFQVRSDSMKIFLSIFPNAHNAGFVKHY